jgi:hypothetical protein
VICPSDAVAAILKGAVMFGHNQELISERICPRTYGISVSAPFDNRKHPNKLKAFSNGKYVCTDVFQVIVRLGEPLIVGKGILRYRVLRIRRLILWRTSKYTNHPMKTQCIH